MSSTVFINLPNSSLLQVKVEPENRLICFIYKISITSNCENVLKLVRSCELFKTEHPIKSIGLRNLFDVFLLFENTYLLVDFGHQKQLHKVIYDGRVDIKLKIETVLDSKAEIFECCHGPLILSVQGNYLIATKSRNQTVFKIPDYLSSNLIIDSFIDISSVEISINLLCLVRNDKHVNLSRLCIDANIKNYTFEVTESSVTPEVYHEIISCFRIVPSNQAHLFYEKFDIEQNANKESVCIACTVKQQALVFIDGSVVTYCEIPSKRICDVLIYTRETSDIYILLISESFDIYVLLFHDAVLKVVRCFENYDTVCIGNFMEDGLEKLLFCKCVDLKQVLITDMQSNFHVNSNDFCADTSSPCSNFNSAVSTIHSKVMNMKVMQKNISHEIFEKTKVINDLKSQLKALKTGCSLNCIDDKDRYLVSLFDETKGNESSQSKKIVEGSALMFEEFTWKIFHVQNSNIYVRINIINNSDSMIEDISILSIVNVSCHLKTVLAKVQGLKNLMVLKQMKFDEAYNSLLPGQCGIVGVLLYASGYENSRIELNLNLMFSSQGMKQQVSRKLNVDVLESINQSDYLMEEDDLFISHLSLLNLFQVKVQLSFHSLYSNLNEITSILMSCGQFKFIHKKLYSLIFSRVPLLRGKESTITLKVKKKSDKESVVNFYSNEEEDVLLFIKALNSSPEFPKDIIMLPRLLQSCDAKESVVFNLKHELSYITDWLSNLNQGTVSEKIEESSNLLVKDTIINRTRVSFGKKQEALLKDLNITSEEYSKFLSLLQTLQGSTNKISSGCFR